MHIVKAEKRMMWNIISNMNRNILNNLFAFGGINLGFSFQNRKEVHNMYSEITENMFIFPCLQVFQASVTYLRMQCHTTSDL